MQTITVTVARSDLLSLNQRLDRRAKARLTKQLRVIGRGASRGHQTMLKQMHCTAVLTFPTAGRRDVHNYMPSLKALIDGLVDAGVLIDDSRKYLIGPDLREGDSPSPMNRKLKRVRIEMIFKEVS